MARVTKEDGLGWPTHIKDAKQREASIAKKMKGQQFENVVLKGDSKVINWNLVRKFKRTHE